MWIEQGARVEPRAAPTSPASSPRDSERWSRIAKAANIKME